MTSCFNCGEDADSFEYVGRQRLYCCDQPECDRALCNELRAYEKELAEKARADGYERYR